MQSSSQTSLTSSSSVSCDLTTTVFLQRRSLTLPLQKMAKYIIALFVLVAVIASAMAHPHPAEQQQKQAGETLQTANSFGLGYGGLGGLGGYGLYGGGLGGYGLYGGYGLGGLGGFGGGLGLYGR